MKRCHGPRCHFPALPGRWLCLACGNRYAVSPEGRRADAAAERLGQRSERALAMAASIGQAALMDWINRMEAERRNGGAA